MLVTKHISENRLWFLYLNQQDLFYFLFKETSDHVATELNCFSLHISSMQQYFWKNKDLGIVTTTKSIAGLTL